MSKIEIIKDNVMNAYKQANCDGKTLLSNLFGRRLFSDPMERIRTIEDACAEVGEDINEIRRTYPDDSLSWKFLTIIARALNGGWEPNWNNRSEYKWYPWFEYGSSGFRFSGSVCTYTGTNADVGSRLCFKSEELANYAGKQFQELYNDYLTRTK